MRHSNWVWHGSSPGRLSFCMWACQWNTPLYSEFESYLLTAEECRSTGTQGIQGFCLVPLPRGLFISFKLYSFQSQATCLLSFSKFQSHPPLEILIPGFFPSHQSFYLLLHTPHSPSNSWSIWPIPLHFQCFKGSLKQVL